jgi:hypothetical protein
MAGVAIVGDVKVWPPSCAAFTAALQVKPVLVVQLSALADVLQLGIAKAVGLADDAVALASTVFAACAARDAPETAPHAGALDAPVDTIACPAVEPAGLSSWIGLSVAPNAIEESASSAIERSRFIFSP